MPWFSVAHPSASRRARHRTRALLTACAAIAIAAPAARAQPVTLTFDGLTAVDASGVRFVDNCYEEGGFRVSLGGFPCGTAAALATWTPDNDLYYTGTPALYNNFDGSIEIVSVSGRAFNLTSIGLAPFLGQLGLPASVTFTGFGSGGVVSRTVDVPGGVFGTPTALTSFAFTDFNKLTSLRLTVVDPVVEPFIQLDDVAINAVPEPSTVLLVAGGLACLGALARRRVRAGAR